MENSQLSSPNNATRHQILDILQYANLALSTRAKYIRVVEGYLATGHALTDQAALAAYAATLSPSRRGHLKSAVRKWTQAMTTAVKAQATPNNINSIQATLLRFEALQDTITDGFVLISLGRGNRLGDRLTAVSLFRIINKYGKRMGKPQLAPHDIRRTYAQLGYEAGVPITQISTLLGHASIETTMRYLNLELDMVMTVSDFIPYERQIAG